MAILHVPRRRERDIERFIAEAVPHKPVLLLDGARQVGKTTLVDAVLDRSAKDSVRIDLERDTLVRSAIDDCADFAEFEDLLLDRFGYRGDADRILFVDEAQESRSRPLAGRRAAG